MHSIVKPDGQLDEEKIWRRETLYKGMNGSCVERIYVTPADTLIFKPLTNNDQTRQGSVGIRAYIVSPSALSIQK